MIDFRIYGKPNCTLFSMQENGEVGQSKGLGYVLSSSEKALYSIVKLIDNASEEKKTGLKKSIIKNYQVIVDCELRQDLDNRKSFRADVVVRFYSKERTPIHAILIETKSKGKNISEKFATEQIIEYFKTFDELKPFDNKISMVTITDVKTMYSNVEGTPVISITWGDLMASFENIDDPLVKDYINYLLNINGNMKQYDKEILSIPAGKSYDIIKKSNIYCCPVGKKYDSRANGHPLYLAFRKSKSIIGELLKIRDILQVERPLSEDIKSYLSKTYGNDVVSNIDQYWQPQKIENSYVFIIDPNKTIILPKPVKFLKGNAYDKALTFAEVLRKVETDYVEI